jgi:glycosyltransferase involved in cell wall biosynthesis
MISRLNKVLSMEVSESGVAVTPRRALRALGLMSETYADGGIQRFNRTFLAACDGLGIACDVLSLGDSEAARSRWTAPSLMSVAVFDHNKPHFALATIGKVARGGYDVILVGHINLLVLAITAAKLGRNARIILIAHGIEVWTGLTGLRRRALSSVDSILCVSRYTQEAIQKQVPELPVDRFIVFPNALSESWRELPPVSRFRSKRQLPGRFLLSVSRLDRGDRYKGIVTVLEALAMMEDESVHYVIAGRGNDLEFIKRVAERCNVSDRVHFCGSVPDEELASLYTRCLAFVLPSGKEGFGIVFLEAMFFGACVIAAREKGAVDVVRHEETGLLVPYGDVRALKQVIDRVIADTALRERMCAAGHATVVGDGAFTFRSYVRRLAGVFNVSVPDVIAGEESAPELEVAVSADETCV